MQPLLPEQGHSIVTSEIAAAFDRLRPEIKRLVQRHLDIRIRSRVDPSDVVQSTFLDANQRLDRYLRERPMPVREWLFYLAKMKSLETNHHHLDTQKRDARREYDCAAMEAVRGDQSTPSQCVSRKELHRRLAASVRLLPYRYRIAIELRHFRGCSNKQVSQFLEISEKAASKLYIRAIDKLRTTMTPE